MRRLWMPYKYSWNDNFVLTIKTEVICFEYNKVYFYHRSPKIFAKQNIYKIWQNSLILYKEFWILLLQTGVRICSHICFIVAINELPIWLGTQQKLTILPFQQLDGNYNIYLKYRDCQCLHYLKTVIIFALFSILLCYP